MPVLISFFHTEICFRFYDDASARARQREPKNEEESLFRNGLRQKKEDEEEEEASYSYLTPFSPPFCSPSSFSIFDAAEHF